MNNLTFKTRVTPELSEYITTRLPASDWAVFENGSFTCYVTEDRIQHWTDAAWPEIPAEEAIRRLQGDELCKTCNGHGAVGTHATNTDPCPDCIDGCTPRQQPQPDESELKPCPFCGGEAELWKPDAVGCPDCCIYTDPELWNTRK